MKTAIPKSRLLITISVLLLWLLIFSSCTAPSSYYGYAETAFVARVEGRLDGVEVQAKIAAVPTDGGFFAEVEYLAPESLAGLSLTGSCNRDGEAIGEITYRFFEKSGTVNASLCKPLLLPITSLLNAQEPMRVERNEQGYLLSFTENGLLQLNSESIPTHVRAKDADFWVVWWDFQEKTP